MRTRRIASANNRDIILDLSVILVSNRLLCQLSNLIHSTSYASVHIQILELRKPTAEVDAGVMEILAD
jgi:hypothetical protein